jgi:hypothetical protein
MLLLVAEMKASHQMIGQQVHLWVTKFCISKSLEGMLFLIIHTYDNTSSVVSYWQFEIWLLELCLLFLILHIDSSITDASI